MRNIFLIFFFITFKIFSQDTLKYPWPITPFNETHTITGTFCEYRNTLTANHFHNGTDIPKADGSPVYSVINGTIATISPSSVSGSNAYVRVIGQIGGVTKSMAYVHIEPNSSLTVGSTVVASVTVIGNILNGMGHVHLIDGEYNSEINVLRDNGGVTPFVDEWTPKILSVKFFQNNSAAQYSQNKISGLVDIIAEVAERNSSGEPNSSSTTNNGIYATGFALYNFDKTQILYSPPVNNLRYIFRWKPSDTYVNNVFTTYSTTGSHNYILTNGNGIIGSGKSQITSDNFFNAKNYSPGFYQIMVFALDTRGNADTIFIPIEILYEDNIAPKTPILKYVTNDSLGVIKISWFKNNEPDLKGYRLYFTTNGTSWNFKENESKLTRNDSEIIYRGITQTTPIYFKITAVDSAAITNESYPSDVYGVAPNITNENVLIVDGFDRIDGGWKKPSHTFAMIMGQSFRNVKFATASNDAVITGDIDILKYDKIFWNVGDEGVLDETLDSVEQIIIKKYLIKNKKIFFSGSNIASDLIGPSINGFKPTESDKLFYRFIFHGSYNGRIENNYSAYGFSKYFKYFNFNYGDTVNGSPYHLNISDKLLNMIETNNIEAFYYTDKTTAAIGSQYSWYGGKTFLSAIPFETIHNKNDRDSLVSKVLRYFDVIDEVKSETTIPKIFSVNQNFPNPFNNSTLIKFNLPKDGGVTFKVFDLLGKEFLQFDNKLFKAGENSVNLKMDKFSSGIYFYKIKFEDKIFTKKMILIK